MTLEEKVDALAAKVDAILAKLEPIGLPIVNDFWSELISHPALPEGETMDPVLAFDDVELCKRARHGLNSKGQPVVFGGNRDRCLKVLKELVAVKNPVDHRIAALAAVNNVERNLAICLVGWGLIDLDHPAGSPLSTSTYGTFAAWRNADLAYYWSQEHPEQEGGTPSGNPEG